MEDYYSRNFFSPPRFYPYYYKNRNYYNQQRTRLNDEHKHLNEKEESYKESTSKQDSRGFNDSNNPIFNVFGINLYFDDILLISLIFFLYNEGVQDQFLFIALILLLLS